MVLLVMVVRWGGGGHICYQTLVSPIFTQRFHTFHISFWKMFNAMCWIIEWYYSWFEEDQTYLNLRKEKARQSQVDATLLKSISRGKGMVQNSWKEKRRRMLHWSRGGQVSTGGIHSCKIRWIWDSKEVYALQTPIQRVCAPKQSLSTAQFRPIHVCHHVIKGQLRAHFRPFRREDWPRNMLEASGLGFP